MAELRRSKKTFKGAVLIMVLTVVCVLTIMLLATLTVVSTANQRSFLKFEENQAYYSARSALDLYITNLFSDGVYEADGQTYVYTDPATGNPSSPTKMKQGLALQLELYKIKSLDNSLGFASNFSKNDNVFPNAAENNNYGTDPSYTDTFIIYEVELPKVSNLDNGKMVDTVGGKQVATIKVEVEKRAYNMSGIEVKDYVITTTPAPTPAEIKAAIAAGDRSKDAMQLKITATVELMGVEGVAIVIADTAKKEVVSTKNALTSIGGINDSGGTQMSPLGGTSTLSLNDIKIGDGNKTPITGNLFTIGSFTWNTSQSKTVLGDGDGVVVMGNIDISGGSADISATANGTYFFAGGEMKLKNNVGPATKKMSIIATKLSRVSTNPFIINGNVYVDTLDLSNGALAQEHLEITGTLYVKNLILPAGAKSGNGTPGNPIKYNLESITKIGNIKLCTGYTIKSGTDDIYLTDTLVTKDGNPITNISTVPQSAFNLYDFTVVEKENKIYREYTLNEDLPGTTNKIVEVPTAQAYFGEYFKADAFHTWGDLKNYNNQTDLIMTSPNNDYSIIYNPTNIEKWQLTAVDLLNDYLELEDSARYTSITAAATALGAIPLNGGITNIDVSNGDVFYVMTGSGSQTNVKVTGKGGRAIFLIPENTTAWYQKLFIETDKIYMSGDIVNGTTEAAPIDYYGGTNSKLETQNECFIAGYLKMPTGSIVFPKSSSSYCKYTDENGNTTNNTQPTVVGSVLCGKINTGNDCNFLYIDKDSGNSTPGEPHLTSKPYYYTH